MQIINGRHNSAKVFTDQLEASAREQIARLLDQPFVAGSKIRIMPDVHAGAGCAIGTTMTVRDKVVPNLVGVDIGCGMETVVLASGILQPEKLDRLVRQRIPAGFAIRDCEHAFSARIDLTQLRCHEAINIRRARLSIEIGRAHV